MRLARRSGSAAGRRARQLARRGAVELRDRHLQLMRDQLQHHALKLCIEDEHKCLEEGCGWLSETAQHVGDALHGLSERRRNSQQESGSCRLARTYNESAVAVLY